MRTKYVNSATDPDVLSSIGDVSMTRARDLLAAARQANKPTGPRIAAHVGMPDKSLTPPVVAGVPQRLQLADDIDSQTLHDLLGAVR